MNSNQIENMFVGRNYIHGQFTKRSLESDIFHKELYSKLIKELRIQKKYLDQKVFP